MSKIEKDFLYVPNISTLCDFYSKDDWWQTFLLRIVIFIKHSDINKKCPISKINKKTFRQILEKKEQPCSN